MQFSTIQGHIQENLKFDWGGGRGGGCVPCGRRAKGCVRERDVPPPAQSTEAKTIHLFCEMHGRQKGIHLQH